MALQFAFVGVCISNFSVFLILKVQEIYDRIQDSYPQVPE
jgi:hypothetical protein